MRRREVTVRLCGQLGPNGTDTEFQEGTRKGRELNPEGHLQSSGHQEVNILPLTERLNPARGRRRRTLTDFQTVNCEHVSG